MVWSPLKRDIMLVLAFKVAALGVLYALFFSPHHRHPADVRALFETAVPLLGAQR